MWLHVLGAAPTDEYARNWSNGGGSLIAFLVLIGIVAILVLIRLPSARREIRHERSGVGQTQTRRDLENGWTAANDSSPSPCEVFVAGQLENKYDDDDEDGDEIDDHDEWAEKFL